jgi:hypothetical protein
VQAVPANRSQPRHQTIVSSGEIARKRCHCRPPGFSGSSTPSSITAGTTIFGSPRACSPAWQAPIALGQSEAEAIAVNDHVDEVRVTVTD